MADAVKIIRRPSDVTPDKPKDKPELIAPPKNGHFDFDAFRRQMSA